MKEWMKLKMIGMIWFKIYILIFFEMLVMLCSWLNQIGSCTQWFDVIQMQLADIKDIKLEVLSGLSFSLNSAIVDLAFH